MSDKQAAEAELTDKEPSEIADAFAAIVDETVKLVDALGKALVTTLEDASNLMIVKVNADTREHLDLLVTAGVAKNRRTAATSLIEEGVAAKSGTFARIRQTQDQIADLRKQMRSLVEAHA